ncbi:MAG: hydroxyacid dehydrogenase, partial [Nocardiopsaceae bacterium]|nr:hydroxyacid dehydrogenase [Nocardiopsaceae bacterium]
DPGAVVGDFADPAVATAVSGAEILLTGWGAPRVDRAALEAMPRLRAVVHAAGTVKPHVAPEVFERGVLVTSAAEANAIPVAEFTFAAIVFAAKRVPAAARAYRELRDRTAWPGSGATGAAGAAGTHRTPGAVGAIETAGAAGAAGAFVGANGITVGVVGASRVGRRVLRLLENLSVTALVADPYLPDPDAAALGAARVGLDELMARSDVVTLHAPALPSTRHLIGAARLAAMKDGAVLVNTARGALVDTGALVAEARGGRISAILDVTDPEPPPPDSPLWELPNVTLTPHIAGAMGNEVPRLLEQAIGEIERLAAGLAPRYPVTAADLERIA